MLAERDRDRTGVGRQDPEQLLVARRDERVELRGRTRAVRKVEVEQHVGDGAAVEPAPGAGNTLPRPERRIAVPPDDDENVAGDAGAHRQRGVLQRCGRAGTAHVHGRGEPQVFDAEVGRELLAARVAGRRDDAVDVGHREPCVGDRGGRGFEHELHRQAIGPAHVVGFTDTDDRRAIREAAHERRMLREHDGGLCYGLTAKETGRALEGASPKCLASPNERTRPVLSTTQ